MFNLKTMLPIAAKKLVEYVRENDGKIQFSINYINDWFKKSGHPFRLLVVEDVEDGQVLRLILEDK